MIEGKKMEVALIVDEASLLRLELFVELHTVCQFENDSRPNITLRKRHHLKKAGKKITG
jgi:hypothetical protein